jgi:hypothetical protein
VLAVGFRLCYKKGLPRHGKPRKANVLSHIPNHKDAFVTLPDSIDLRNPNIDADTPPLNMLQHALAFASRGFKVFPVRVGRKEPVHDKWQTLATTDPKEIREFWSNGGEVLPYNVGVMADRNMVIIDVDVGFTKAGEKKNGLETFQAVFGCHPAERDTLVVKSARGGFHVYFKTEFQFTQSSQRFKDAYGPLHGIDIKGSGSGYILAPGSSFAGGIYEEVSQFADAMPEPLPGFLIHQWLTLADDQKSHERGISDDSESALEQGRQWLTGAPIAIEGRNGDNTAYRVAAYLCRDLGLSPEGSYQVMSESWNERNLPPFADEQLYQLCVHGEHYGNGERGSQLLENRFQDSPEVIEMIVEAQKEAEATATENAANASKAAALEDEEECVEEECVEAFAGNAAPTPAKAKAKTNEWPEPKPLRSLLDVAPFQPEMLPAAISDFVIDAAQRQDCPADYAAAAALASIGSLIANIAHIRPKALDKWTVIPNLWAAVIAPPSAGKSPALASAVKPIVEIENGLIKQWKIDSDNAKRASDIEKNLKSAERKRAVKKLDSVEDEVGKMYLIDSYFEEKKESPCPRLKVGDVTVEKLGALLSENRGGLLVFRDELASLLANLQDEKRGGDRTFYLEAYDGRVSTCDRIDRGSIRIEKCTLSILGGIQPAKVAPLVRGATSGVSDDGLLPRFQLMVWPDPPASFEYVDRDSNEEIERRYSEVFHRLFEMRKARLEGPDDPLTLRFSSEAQGKFVTWYQGIKREGRNASLSNVMRGYLGKLESTVPSLALIFELVQSEGREPKEVSAKSLELAIRWASYLRTHTERIYALAESHDEEAKTIVNRRDKLPNGFSARNVVRKGWSGLTDSRVVDDTLETLIEHGYLKAEPVNNGKPTVHYRWNPKLPPLTL